MGDRIGHRSKAAAFSRAIRSNYAQNFSSTYRPADTAQRNQRPISNRQVFDTKDFSLIAAVSFRRCHPTIHISFLLTRSGSS
jgi:hypothetical protein